MLKKEFKFIEKVYQLWLTIFNYKPKLNIDQFFTTGFGDQKIIMLLEIIDCVRKLIKRKGSKNKNSIQINKESTFSKRSASLKPRKLDLKEEVLKTHEFNQNNETIQTVNAFANDIINNSSEVKSKNSHHHYVALKPPVYEKHKMTVQK